jgi:hypothetical protein
MTDWQPWPPPETMRCLVVREVPDGNRYVDVIAYVHEPESGLPPYPSQVGNSHWMPLPSPPEVK